MKVFLLLIFTVFTGIFLQAQEVFLPLEVNPQLHKNQPVGRVLADTLDLPFMDDFSVLSLQPNPELWMDQDVLVNADFPVDPPSLGVATFDGLDASGQAYNFSGVSGWADALTSKPINLNYTEADSIYLSFYVQSKGLGNTPESSDSIVLEFTHPDTTWVRIWSRPGAGDLSGFVWTNIGIQDSVWLQKGFQFRFRNYGSLAGALDHFHLDYVRLAANRTKNDSLIDDVAYLHRPSPFFEEGLRSIPWKHFRQNQSTYFQDTIFSSFVNRSVDIKNVDFRFGIFDTDGNQLYLHPQAADNVNPGQTYQRNYPVNLSINDPDQRRHDLVTEFYLNTQPDINAFNDTLRNQIIMNEHYAYDDGTAEVAYGLQGALTRLGVKYQLRQGFSDTLTGIAIHFGQAVSSTTGKQFKLRVWPDNNGVPGNPIYAPDSIVTVQPVNHVQGFTYYEFDTTLILSGTYYIGMVQLGSDPLAIGFDRNSRAEKNIRIDLGTGWQGSLQTGALMMRPVFGTVGETLSTKTDPEAKEWSIYPNPGSDRIHIKSRFLVQPKLILYNALGSVVAEADGNQILTHHLPPGIYLLELRENGQSSGIRKWVKSN